MTAIDMDWEALFGQHEAGLEDFWGRRQNRPMHGCDFTVFGHPARLISNDRAVLSAVDHAQTLYSVAPKKDDPPFTIQVIARATSPSPGALPENLADQMQYAGDANWLAMHLGPWGHCQVDLTNKRALAVLAPELAAQPAMVSRYLLNTILTNFLIASGYGYLHATGLLKGSQVILLMAAHNSGKSTAALRLALAGYRLLTDSMVFIGRRTETVRLYGFPIGRVKLRQDMVPDFPQLKPLMEAEPVRGETKYAVDLRRVDPNLALESAVEPSEISLCLLSRADDPDTSVRPAALAEVTASVMSNSLFYDEAPVWKENLERIRLVVERARHFHLAVGSDPERLVAAVDSLMLA